MTKADIARGIHQQAGVSEAEAADLFERVVQLLMSTLQRGEPIIITGFGRFTIRMKQPRKGRNPRTGEVLIVPGRKVVTFRPSALWKGRTECRRHDHYGVKASICIEVRYFQEGRCYEENGDCDRVATSSLWLPVPYVVNVCEPAS
jgi:integration host factor subunit alpha